MPDLPGEIPGKRKSWLYGLLLFYALVLVAGAAFIKREEFYTLLAWQFLLHAGYIVIFRFRKSLSLTHLVWAAILMRLALAFIMPALSEDVYRFVWDGQLILSGENPMLSTPDSYLATLNTAAPGFSYFTSLHSLINHPQYFTVYPPLMQSVFWLSAALGFKSIGLSVVIIKLVLAIADGFTIYFLVKILKRMNLDPGLVLLYALHPLVMVEGSGNAHFEVMQAAFISGSIYFLYVKKTYIAAVLWGLAIATKLLPLLLLPLLWSYLGLRKGFLFCCICISVAVTSFLPFLNLEAINAFSQSINLFIQKFEFNASIYYIARAIGMRITGYNQVAILGPMLLSIFLLIYVSILFKKRQRCFKNLVSQALLIFTLYFLFSTTVHPWYIITLLPFAALSSNYFAFVWMSTAFLSYNAYTSTTVHENLWLIVLEYSLPAFIFLVEWRNKKTGASLSAE